jgi:hypothetical protein
MTIPEIVAAVMAAQQQQQRVNVVREPTPPPVAPVAEQEPVPTFYDGTDE